MDRRVTLALLGFVVLAGAAGVSYLLLSSQAAPPSEATAGTAKTAERPDVDAGAASAAAGHSGATVDAAEASAMAQEAARRAADARRIAEVGRNILGSGGVRDALKALEPEVHACWAGLGSDVPPGGTLELDITFEAGRIIGLEAGGPPASSADLIACVRRAGASVQVEQGQQAGPRRLTVTVPFELPPGS